LDFTRIEGTSINLNKAIYSIYTANGQLVMPPKTLKSNELLSIPANFKSGLYYVKLIVQNKIYQKKLLVLRCVFFNFYLTIVSKLFSLMIYF